MKLESYWKYLVALQRSHDQIMGAVIDIPDSSQCNLIAMSFLLKWNVNLIDMGNRWGASINNI